MQKGSSAFSRLKGERGSVFIASKNVHSRRSLKDRLLRLGYDAATFCSASDLLRDLQDHSPPVAVIFELGPELERDLGSLDDVAARTRPAPVIALSSHTDPETVVRAMRHGAVSFVPRPFKESDLRKAIDTALEEHRTATPPRNPNILSHGNHRWFVCSSPRMQSLQEMAQRVADSDITILIRGESGSGKEVIARYIHRCSPRRKGPFVKVNCAALPEELLESELFGYEKGAFTGATTSKRGKFEAAEGGTILLDEITETSGRLQAKLLQVLQDKQFSHLGGNRNIGVDVRVLAATNADLEREIEEGRFREDLYFRLKVIDLYVPPLRERREEIPLLIDHFRRHFAAQYRRPVPRLSEKLLHLLTNYRWTGNVRELENIMKRLVILGEEIGVMREILAESEVPVVRATPPSRMLEPESEATESKLSLRKVGQQAAAAAERTLILSTLEQTRWNRLRASRMLGVSYKTLLSKMKKCGLSEE